MNKLSGAPTDLTIKNRGKKRNKTVKRSGFWDSFNSFKRKSKKHPSKHVARRLTKIMDFRYPNTIEKALMRMGYKGKWAAKYWGEKDNSRDRCFISAGLYKVFAATI